MVTSKQPVNHHDDRFFCVWHLVRHEAFCDASAVACWRLGKLIAATDDAPRGGLQRLWEQERRNGVEDLQFPDARQAFELEPELSCVAVLLSPSTGIVDSDVLMLALQAEIMGTSFAFHSSFEYAHCGREDFELQMGGA